MDSICSNVNKASALVDEAVARQWLGGWQSAWFLDNQKSRYQAGCLLCAQRGFK